MEITENAVKEGKSLIERLQKEEDPSIIGLFLGVKGGGCAGFQYDIGSIKKEDVGDNLLTEKDGFKIYTDPISMTFLDEATIDWEVGALGSRLVIINPSVTSSCGCGASFS